MSNTVIMVGLLVGLVNYLFRYLPLRLGHTARKPGAGKQGVISLLLDNIGIASICALLVVSSTPDILASHQRLLPTMAGFAALAACFYKTRSIILSTLVSALTFGLVFKIMLVYP